MGGPSLQQCLCCISLKTGATLTGYACTLLAVAGLVELCVASAVKNHLLLAFAFVQILLTPAAYAFWQQKGDYQPESKKRTYANYFLIG